MPSIDAAGLSRAELTTLAADAFVYGFPLVYDLRQVARFTREGMGGLPPTPLNVFGHATTLAGPQDTFVSINNDTVYSIANVSTAAGPVRFDVPETGGRYYVMQFVDAWTNNFAYIGHRATGTLPGAYLLVAPGWDGMPPEGVTVVEFPTTIATIVGRWAVDGESDLPAVRALQNALHLMPTAPVPDLPAPAPGVPEDLRFFEELRAGIRAFPPADRDRRYQQRFEPLGLLDAETPYTDLGPERAAALREGLAAGKQLLETAATHSSAPRQNGWSLTYHVFDYNLDFFGVGALDDPHWKLPDDPERYLRRAGAARAGLWGNHGYEAAYAMTFTDCEDRPLHGSHRYEVRFAEPPPCGAFWSLTMYDTPDFFLVANPIERYSLGDRTPGLHTVDGSLTVLLQHDEPADPRQRANWLPTPPGPFRPMLRIYEPRDPVFDGSYQLPPIVRID
ncbi:DUF1254 domain-containing protein [Nocardia testacea]|uniref:DUF1254 domain-containing protein n=1 Tax=Nocardia testacea TaxID=248551 RepID=UPI003C2C4E2C